MSDETPDDEDLVAAVLDGAAIDWDRAEAGADESRAARVRQLRVVAQVARMCHQSRISPAVRNEDGSAGPAEVRGPARWGPFQLLDKVGEGAFGEVYRAWDDRLQREVAVKFVREATGDPSCRRAVIDEARLLARVRHVNVVSVYGADTIDNRAAFWTEFVHGRTLEAIVRESGPFGPQETALIGLDLCRALAAIHRAGLLHGDVKAANVMREEGGRTVLMDLGMGRHVTAYSDPHPSPGGTPLYLAPEVLVGCPPTVRSDIYSLGVLLYHLLTGRYPVVAETVDDIKDAHAGGEVRRLRDERADIPVPLINAIERSIEPDAADRFGTAGELERALFEGLPARPSAAVMATPTAGASRPASTRPDGRGRLRRMAAAPIAIVVMVGVVGVGWYAARRRPASPPLPFEARDWVLVSAFENRTGDPTLDGTIDYAVEQDLANSPFVNVVPRARINDDLALMKRPATTRIDESIGLEVCERDGGIRGLLTGRVMKLGESYSVSVTLLDPARHGQPVMSTSVEVAAKGALLDAVRNLVDRIRTTLGEQLHGLGDLGRPRENVTTVSLRAWQLYGQGMALGDSGGKQAWSLAAGLFKQATAEDEQFASAHMLLAHALRNTSRPREEWLPHAQRAFDLATTASDRERYFIAGSYYDMTNQRAKAIEAYESLLHLYPDHYWATNNLMLAYDALGRSEDAARLALRLVQLRPNNFDSNMYAAQILVSALHPLEEVRPFVARAQRLLPDGEFPAFQAWVRLFPAFDAWMMGDLPAAARLTDEVVRQQDRICIQRAVTLDLTFGRLQAAEAAALPTADSPSRECLLAHVAFWRGDLPALRLHARRTVAMLATPAGSGGGVPLLPLACILVRARQFADAQRVASLIPTRGRAENAPVMNAILALAVREDASAIAAMEQLRPSLVRGWIPYLYSTELLADVVARHGDFPRACRLLEEASASRMGTWYNGSSGVDWLSARARLATLYRQMDRMAEAEAVDAELSKLLAYADQDFILLRDLQRRDGSAYWRSDRRN